MMTSQSCSELRPGFCILKGRSDIDEFVQKGSLGDSD